MLFIRKKNDYVAERGKFLNLAIDMKVIKATKYLDIHYFQIPGQRAPHKILNHYNSLLQVTSIQLYKNKSI